MGFGKVIGGEVLFDWWKEGLIFLGKIVLFPVAKEYRAT